MDFSRILIADSSPLVRERLASALIAQFPEARIKEASTTGGVEEMARDFSPHVLLLDPGLPGDSLVELISGVVGAEGSECRVVVLAWESSHYTARCVAAGAHAVVDKAEPDLVIGAVREALAAGDADRLSRSRTDRAIA